MESDAIPLFRLMGIWPWHTTEKNALDLYYTVNTKHVKNFCYLYMRLSSAYLPLLILMVVYFMVYETT